MKILHVCSNYFPAHGGPQHMMKNLSEKFIEQYGDQVEVATSNSLYGPDLRTFKKITPAKETINGVHIYRFPLRNWHYNMLELGNRLSKRILKKPIPHALYKYRTELDCKGILNKMKETDADVIVATTSHYMFCDYPFWRFKTNNPKPFVLYGAMHLHINWPVDSPLFNRAKICDCYIANTAFEKQWLVERGIQEDKIVTIGTAIDLNSYTCAQEQVATFRKQYNIKEDDILIGYIGRLSEGKGVGLLLEAYSNIYKTNNNVKLVLAGTYTDYVLVIQEKIKALNLPVILLENFQDELKPILFNALDVFVLASKGESFGIVFLEAWACRKPVIGVKTGAIASIISENVDGLLFEAGSAIALSCKIDYLVNNKEDRNKLGENGYQKVKQRYTWDVVVDKYRQAYLKAINNFNIHKQARSF